MHVFWCARKPEHPGGRPAIQVLTRPELACPRRSGGMERIQEGTAPEPSRDIKQNERRGIGR